MCNIGRKNPKFICTKDTGNIRQLLMKTIDITDIWHEVLPERKLKSTSHYPKDHLFMKIVNFTSLCCENDS